MLVYQRVLEFGGQGQKSLFIELLTAILQKRNFDCQWNKFERSLLDSKNIPKKIYIYIYVYSSGFSD